MPIDRKQIASALREIAELCELAGENPFKCRAYEQAARTVERMKEGLDDLVARKSLTSLRGIGPGTASQILALAETGTSPLLEQLRAGFPGGLLKLLGLPGLGPKRLRVLYQGLGITSLGELEYAIHENRLLDLPGFGARSQEGLLTAIERMRRHEGRYLLPDGWLAAEQTLARIGRSGERIEIAGELRRQLETLSGLLLIRQVETDAENREETQTADNGVGVRILSRSRASFEASWLWESCSEVHREELCARATERGLTLDASGLWSDKKRLPLDEEGIYRQLDLEPIHPLLREGSPETAPKESPLIGPETIRGLFHVHTTESDGAGSLEEMVEEAQRLGLRWIGIADHSQSAGYANGLTPDRLKQQSEEIARTQDRFPSVRILHGIESDILADGALDYEESQLAQLDFVIASVHSGFRMDRETMTRRIEKALRHPATTHWGHPTGRLLLARDPYDCDVEHLLRVCADEGVSVEFNANPHRLDLDWRLIPKAREWGIPVSINPDAHTKEGLADARLTVGTAAKGGLTPPDVLNNLDTEEIIQWLRR